MQVGMNLLLWTAHPSPEEHGPLLQQIRDWGFDGVEFPIGATTENEARGLARLCDELGLGRTAIGSISGPDADPVSADPKLRRAATDRFKRFVDISQTLGSEIFTGPIFQTLGNFSGQPPTRDEWNRSVDVIREVAEYAATMHLKLALEHLNRFESYLVNTIKDGARFCEQVGLPNVGLLADTHHANIEEERPAEAWRKHASWIEHVHISENHRGVPGRGHACGPEIFRSLRESGYDGWLTIEAFGLKVAPLIPRLHLWRPFFEREEDVAVEGLKHIRDNWALAAAVVG